MSSQREPERVQTIVIGGGQAGLSVGYHLAQRGLPFVILDAHARIGDAWRQRWDSLRLFSPARFNGLAGMPFPAPAHSFPTKDEMADYLEAYAARFELPVRTGVKVDRLSKRGERFEVAAGERRFEAENVVVAMASYQRPRVPAFAGELGPGVVQLHSSAYRNPTAAAGRGCSRGGGRQLGRRDRPRSGPRPPDVALGAGHRPPPLPHRGRSRASGHPAPLPDRLPSPADRGHPAGPQGAPEAALPRYAADPGQAPGPGRGRHRARPQDGRVCGAGCLSWRTAASWTWRT